ncbi:unnamed protein product [Porites evermanni]|uniref:Uncharacterized protein n=1 Tax=Porites evermanni TaxID=104178 RepID=A0ABN8SM42_9CNID|nr:unnamed protein product [Porites evermanni]
MDEFLRRCKEEYCLGLERNEKSWLRSFYYDVEKCIRQNESDAEFAEVCFFALQKINQHQNEHDEKEAFSPWLLNHQQIATMTSTTAVVDMDSWGEYISISRIPSILLGYLTIHPKSAKPPAASGTLYIEDNYTTVVCEITNPDRWCLDKLVVISEWNYVPQSSLPSMKLTNK